MSSLELPVRKVSRGLALVVSSLLMSGVWLGCGDNAGDSVGYKNSSDHVEPGEVRTAIERLGFTIAYRQVTPPTGIGVQEVVAGRATNSSGVATDFAVVVWNDARKGAPDPWYPAVRRADKLDYWVDNVHVIDNYGSRAGDDRHGGPEMQYKIRREIELMTGNPNSGP